MECCFELYKKPVEIFDNGVAFKNTNEDDSKDIFYECDSVIIAVSQSPKNNIVVNNKGF